MALFRAISAVCIELSWDDVERCSPGPPYGRAPAPWNLLNRWQAVPPLEGIEFMSTVTEHFLIWENSPHRVGYGFSF